MSKVDVRLSELAITLPEASNPAANYTNCVLTGKLLYVSGKGPPPNAAGPIKGRLGREFSTKDGYDLARLTALDILAAVKLELGSLDRVRRVVKLQGFVNATPDFGGQTQGVKGGSGLMGLGFGGGGGYSPSGLRGALLRAGLPNCFFSTSPTHET